VAVLGMSAAIVTLEVCAELARITIITGARVVAVHIAFNTIRALTESPNIMSRTVAPIMAVFVMRATIITLEVCAELSAEAVVTSAGVVAVDGPFYTIRALTEGPDVMSRTVAPIMAVFIMSAAIVTLEARAELATITIVTSAGVIGVHVSFDTVRVLTIEACIMGGAVAVFAVLYRSSSIVTHC
jgi:hypothetical protein